MVSSDNPADARTLELMVRQIRFEGRGINSYEFVDPSGELLPAFTAGAHIDVHVKDGFVRQYSLCNSPNERHRYVIAVLRDEAGRGGSKALHERLHVQDKVRIGHPEHWTSGTVHFEHFKAPERAASDNVAAAAGEFIVKIASTGQQIPVSGDRSIADALEDAGVAIETSCRAGLCGTCKVRYLSGEVEHNDCILGDDEKQEYLTTCVSRALNRELVLDL